jgi:hypothetical protein
MFKPNSKYRLHFLILVLVVFILGSISAFYDYAEKKEGMRLIGGIAFGLMSIFYFFDVYEFIKNKNPEKLNSAHKSTRE